MRTNLAWLLALTALLSVSVPAEARAFQLASWTIDAGNGWAYTSEDYPEVAFIHRETGGAVLPGEFGLVVPVERFAWTESHLVIHSWDMRSRQDVYLVVPREPRRREVPWYLTIHSDIDGVVGPLSEEDLLDHPALAPFLSDVEWRSGAPTRMDFPVFRRLASVVVIGVAVGVLIFVACCVRLGRRRGGRGEAPDANVPIGDYPAP